MPVSDQPPAIYQLKNSGTDSFKSFAPAAIVISNTKGMVVSISSKDGSVTFGEGITPTAAAKEFWDQITRFYPNVCAQQQAK